MATETKVTTEAKPRVLAPFSRRFLKGKKSLRATVPIALILIAGGVAIITLTPQGEQELHETTQQVTIAMRHLRLVEASARLQVLRADVLAERPRAQLLEQVTQIRVLLEPSVAYEGSGVDWGEVRLAFDALRSRIRAEDADVVAAIDELLALLRGAS